MQEKQYIEEDEIDLSELFKTIMKRKFVVIFSTLFITIMSAIYAFTATPMYEVKALVEVGIYNKNPISPVSTVIPEINNFLIMTVDKDKINNIVVKKLKKSKSLFEIKVTDKSNDLASSYVMEIMKYIQAKHKIELDKIIYDNTSQYETLDKQIKLKHSIIESIDMKKISPTELLYFMSVTEQLNSIEVKHSRLKTLLLPYNYENTHIVNRILTDDKPVKPKKKLIVIVGFVTGFILSIFLVFLLEFIGRIKEKENE
jgi:LPS O-antigen subunit length determinant protein (WzzB/FepE family)